MRTPIHVLIRQYRLVALALTGFFMWLTVDMWQWFQENHKELSNGASAAYSSLALLAAGAVKWVLENVNKKSEKDDHG